MVDVVRIVVRSIDSEDKEFVKQNELDGDPKFTLIIGLGGKSSSHWKTILKMERSMSGLQKPHIKI